MTVHTLYAACLGLYVFYVVTVVLCTWIYRWQSRRALIYSVPGSPGELCITWPSRHCSDFLSSQDPLLLALCHQPPLPLSGSWLPLHGTPNA